MSRIHFGPRDEDLRPSTGAKLRDHLANERTFLAWVRTGVALMTLGLAIAKFIFTEQGTNNIVGIIIVGAGLASIVYATFQYFAVQRRVEEDTYIPHRVGPFILAVLLMAGGALAVFFIVAG